MDKGLRFRNKSEQTAKISQSLVIPTISGKYRSENRQVGSPIYSEGDSSSAFHSFDSSPRFARFNHQDRSSTNPQKKEIFKDMKEIFKTCREKQSTKTKNEQLKMNRDQKEALYLPQDLHSFCKDHKLREKKVQLKYVNTLKKIKEKGKQMSCQVRAKSQGIEFEMRKETQQKQKDLLGYTFSKDLGRFFKKKMVKEVRKCKEDVVSMKVTASDHCQKMVDALKKNERDEVYKGFNCERIDKFMKSKATQKKQYPYYIKQQLDSKFAAIRRKEMTRSDSVGSEEQIVTLQGNSPTISKKRQNQKSQKQIPLERTLEGISSARITTSSKKTSSEKFKQFEEDIEEFIEIIQFFQRIQNELSKFLPNNHLANKIDIMVNQVEHSDMVSKVYQKANKSLKYFRPDRIVAILKSCPGILGNMNYIVNVIKLNISAERRRRLIDQEKKVRDYQGIVNDANKKICQQLKKTSDKDLKKDIWSTLQKSQYRCLSLNPVYSDFANHNDEQDHSLLYTKGNRNYQCEILQYQTLLK